MSLTWTNPTPHQMIMNQLDDAIVAKGGLPRYARPPAYTPVTLEGLIANEQAAAGGEPPPAPAMDPLSNNYARLGLEAPPSVDYAAGNRERVRNTPNMFATENPLTLLSRTPPPELDPNDPLSYEHLIAHKASQDRAALAAAGKDPLSLHSRTPPPQYEALTLEGLIANEEAARRGASATPAPVRQQNPNEPPPYEAPVAW